LNVSPQGKNKDDATLELYVDALDPLKATLTDIHPEVGLLYIKIGYLYGKKGDRNLSALAYKAALKAYGEPWSFSSGKVHPEVVSAWVGLTEHLMELKCWQEVLVAGRRALFLLRAAKKTLYQDAQLRPPSVDDRPQSSSKNAKISPIQITSSTYYEALYTTLQCLGQAHTSLSQFSLAKMACEESLHMAWEIALANNIDPVDPLKPNNQATIATLVQIIRAFKRLGKVLLLQKHYSDSLECFLPALQLLRSSSELESTLDAASVLGSLGFLHLKMERFLEATNFFKECLRLYQQNGR
jgi:tetratricopeptide (TPR) repeat protein